MIGKGRMTVALAALTLACDTQTLQAVVSPGGAFRSGAGCAIDQLEAAGAASCRTNAELTFEQLGDEERIEVSSGNLSRKRLSCSRSYCGTGALAVHAEYRWPRGPRPPITETLGALRYKLAAPVDLLDKSLTYALFVDGINTPVNASIGVIDGTGRFRHVHDGPVLVFGQWTQRGAPIGPANTMLALPEGTTSFVVKEISISIYLATEVRRGDLEHWSAELYVDQIGWR